MRKMILLEVELDNLKLRDLLLIWDQAGIGCQMFLKNFLMISGKKSTKDFYEIKKLNPAYRVYFGLDRLH